MMGLYCSGGVNPAHTTRSSLFSRNQEQIPSNACVKPPLDFKELQGPPEPVPSHPSPQPEGELNRLALHQETKAQLMVRAGRGLGVTGG